MIRDSATAHSPAFRLDLAGRYRRGVVWSTVFLILTLLSVFFLATLIWSIVNDSFGYVILVNETDPATLSGDDRPLESLEAPLLVAILEDRLPGRRLRALANEAPLENRSRENLHAVVMEEIVRPEVMVTFDLADSILDKDRITRLMEADYPGGTLVFRSWLNRAFLMSAQSSEASAAGVRGAILGSLMTILVTLFTAFPVGIGAAIYLEEYAADTRLNRFIRINIFNLAGVPSIIYGMLGLAIFVRAAEPFTSGALFGAAADPTTANGRTILSAGLTLALLILPVIIINAQEALRAVSGSLRQSSLAVGATRWQTVWHHVLPSSFDRILTGTVLAMSRAIGETAPLVVVGASTFLSRDPTSIFSRFTTLPIQIFQWTVRPQEDFRRIAAAAILVLLTLLLSMNTVAILSRNRLRAKKRLSR
ncbi:MAG TPA: phosphate ABC transporter permease PstA [Magnetospirillaceae bacterium]|nr:phosphate ABC transporter permease PstA [Magnetospirillaceae bacterium]